MSSTELTGNTRSSITSFLPYELQRNIFELAAQAYPECAPRLAVVSNYVQTWIEPVIYRIVVLDFPFASIQLFIRTFRTRPSSFFAKHVKHLHITSIIGVSDAREIVSACTGALTVECWVDARPHIPGIHFILPTRTLQRLSIKIETLWGYTDNLKAYKFRPEDYPQLTHLEIVNPPGHNSSVNLDWEGISELPSLIYLALGDMWGYDHCYLFNAMEEILRRCPKLRALIVMSRDHEFNCAFELEPVLHNPRLVLLPSFHWPDSHVGYRKKIRRGGPDIWDRAERFRSEQEKDESVCQNLFCCVPPSDSLIEVALPCNANGSFQQ